MFENFQFTESQINDYFQSALHNLAIAKKDYEPEVVFKFCYEAILKLAIAVCAKNNLRVKARQGHHIELIQKLSEFMNDKEIEIIGEEMRSKRNRDLYNGGVLISEKEAGDYLLWAEKIFQEVNHLFK